MAQTQSMTIAAFSAIDEPGRFDLIRGELLRMAPTGGEHGEIAMELARHIANHVADHALGRVYIDETGFILSQEPPIVLSPDIAFVANDRLPPRPARRGFLELAPDLAVEIVSPSDRIRQVNLKIDEYLAAGVRLVWVIEPGQRRATIHGADRTSIILGEDDDFDGEDILPGFRLRVGRIFE